MHAPPYATVLILSASVLHWVCLSAQTPQTLPQVVRVAAISIRPVKLDLQGNADRLEQAFRRAAAGGAKIALAPEGVLDGYVVNEILAGNMTEQQLLAVALTLDDPILQRFQQLALELKMCLAFGFAERKCKELYNSAVFLDDRGKLRGRYQKMQFDEGYHPSWWWNRLGSRSRAFDTPFGRAAFMICNDRWNPRLARIPALDGAQFLMIPAFGSTHPSQDEAVRGRAMENGIPVMEANVGVTLIVDAAGDLVSEDREESVITFGDMKIPGPRSANPTMRDQEESIFLEWRAAEMPRRYQEKLQR